MGLLSWTSVGTESVSPELCEVESSAGIENISSYEPNEMELKEKQNVALNKFREKIKDKVPPHLMSDLNLLRWLTARNFNVDKAEDMLLKSLEWRKEWKVDTISEWTPPEVLRNYYAAGMSGYGKDGSPVIIIPYGSSDVRGMLHCCTKRDFIKYTIYVLEMSMEAIRKKSEQLETPITKEIFIFDLEHFSFKEFTWKPALDVVLHLVQMYESNYPEIMKAAYVVNAPKVFSMAFTMIKPFIHEVTLRKIKIFGKESWQEVLLKDIQPDQLPVHWGGTQIDPNGDPKCPSKICVGGKVPEEYYFSINDLKRNSNLQTLLLPRAGRKVFELEVENPQAELRWTFQSDDFDVGFEITVTTLGKEEVLMPYQRVNSHIVPEEGSLKCCRTGLYKIVFDNHYSLMRSKKLYYKLELNYPPDQEE